MTAIAEAKFHRLVSKLPRFEPVAKKTALESAAKKFSKDEMSSGRAARLREVLSGRPIGPGAALHNLGVASRLKDTTAKLFEGKLFRCPLPPSAAPRRGPDGRMVAANGNPLICVNGEKGVSMLVDPKTNEVYKQVGPMFLGPLKLPAGERFIGKKFSEAQLQTFERVANRGVPPVRRAPLGEVLERHLKKGDLKFGQPAPRPDDIAKQVVVKSEHPFTYYAITLKDDPNHVIFKKVLTGGFVPAGPNDGTYSQSVAV